jgi:hypothetical protein
MRRPALLAAAAVLVIGAVLWRWSTRTVEVESRPEIAPASAGEAGEWRPGASGPPAVPRGNGGGAPDRTRVVLVSIPDEPPADDWRVAAQHDIVTRYRQFAERAKLTPEQEERVLRVLADVHVNYTLGQDAVTEHRRERTSRIRGHELEGSPESLALVERLRQEQREDRNAVEMSRAISADAHAAIREILDAEQYKVYWRHFRTNIDLVKVVPVVVVADD